MKFRPVRGGLDESTAELKEFSNRFEFEMFILNAAEHYIDITYTNHGIEVKPYAKWCWPDTRIGWEKTYLVTLNGYPVGYTDGPVPS